MSVNNPALVDPIWRSIHNSAFIGFDELFRTIKELERPKTGFPPYDIIKNSEKHFLIKMAVAGYTKDQISITLESGKLIVTGTPNNLNQSLDYYAGVSDEKAIDYIYKGIAEREFKRVFTLAETVEVEKVNLSDGMLSIFLVNIIPEEKKLKTFTID